MYKNIYAIIGNNNTGKTKILNTLFDTDKTFEPDYYIPENLIKTNFNNKIFINDFLCDYTDTNTPCRKVSINTRFGKLYEYDFYEYYRGFNRAFSLRNRIIMKLKKFYNLPDDFSGHTKIFEEGGKSNKYFIHLIMNILVNIRENSLVLIDDFDDKLDYFYTKKLIEILNFLIEIHKSVLVVSTKSTVILEDLQKENIIATAHRDFNNSPIYTYMPKEQTFGAPLSQIGKDLFLINEEESYYFKFIKNNYKKFKTYEEFFSNYDMGIAGKSLYCILQEYENKEGE